MHHVDLCMFFLHVQLLPPEIDQHLCKKANNFTTKMMLHILYYLQNLGSILIHSSQSLRPRSKAANLVYAAALLLYNLASLGLRLIASV